MADINPDTDARSSNLGGKSGTGDVPAGSAGTDASAVRFVELLFFAYREFTQEPDEILDEFGFGRAHHRVLHFVHRNPGLRVADLLEVLRITKQSLARVLKQLIEDEFVRQVPGQSDRRERHLFVTERGKLLAEKLLRLQTYRIAKALSAAGPDAEDVIRRFLMEIIAEGDRNAVRCIIDKVDHAKR
jgi:DNA-binding MarR family transcriptional regulator